jgi:hypothetical protein
MPANIILAALALILHIAIAIILVRKFLKTRDVGFIWLGVAVVIWPLVSRLFERGEHVFIDRLARHQSVGFYQFSLVERGQMTLGNLVVSLALFQQLIGICLLLVAVLYLARTKPDSNPKMAG